MVLDSTDVLIIDQDRIVLEVAFRGITQAGFAARAARSTAEGLAELEAGLKPLLVLVDLDHAPGMDAANLVSGLKRRTDWASTPVVGMARGREELPGHIPLDGVLTKPFETAQLVAIVREFCR